MSAAISTVHICNTQSRVLELRDSPEGPCVQPSAFGPPAVHGGVLYYGGMFEQGAAGCWSMEEVEHFLNQHFQCREKGKIAAYADSPVTHTLEHRSLFGAI